jgi:hypothetical protein
MSRLRLIGAAALRRLQLYLLALLLVPGLLFGLLRYPSAALVAPDRAWRIAIGIDQLVNVAANGDEDETVSSRADRARAEGRRWGCVLCAVLDWIQTDHCQNARGT